MEIKTNGFKMPNGDIHTFIPPSPTEIDRGGIKAKQKTTESLEVAVDSSTGKAYASAPPIDATLTQQNVAADAKKVGENLSKINNEKLNNSHNSDPLAHSDIRQDIAFLKGDLTQFKIKNQASGKPCVMSDSSDDLLVNLEVYGQSEQVTTTGKNLFPYGVEIGSYSAQTPDKVASDNTRARSVEPVKINDGFNGIISISNGYQIYVRLFKNNQLVKESGTFLSSYRLDNLNNTSDLITIVIRKSNNGAITNVEMNDIKIQIENGVSVTPYEPYTGGKPSPSPEYPQEIVNKVVDKVEVTGANLINAPNQIDSNGWVSKDITSIVKPNTQYYVKANVTNKTLPSSELVSIRIDYTTGGKTEYIFGTSTLNGLISVSFNLSVFDNVKLQFKTKGVNQGTVDITNIMLSTQDIPYEPYKSQTIKLSQPITLRGLKSEQGNVNINGVKYISDVICEKNGVIGVERNVIEQTKSYVARGEVKQGATLNYIFALGKDTFGFNVPAFSNTEAMSFMFSNLLPHNVRQPKLGIYRTWNSIVVTLDKSITTLDQVTQIFNGKSMTIVCQIPSTFEPLPQQDQDNIKQLKSYYPNTIINTNAFTQVNYVADTKMYIDNKFVTLSQAILK